MNEPGPVSFTLLGLFATGLGPVAGPYTLIVFAAGIGAALALSAQGTGTRWQGLKYLAAGMSVSLLLTGPVVWAVQRYTDIPAHIAFVPVAFVLGAARNFVLDFIKQALDAVAAAFGVFLNAAANRRGSGK